MRCLQDHVWKYFHLVLTTEAIQGAKKFTAGWGRCSYLQSVLSILLSILVFSIGKIPWYLFVCFFYYWFIPFPQKWEVQREQGDRARGRRPVLTNLRWSLLDNLTLLNFAGLAKRVWRNEEAEDRGKGEFLKLHQYLRVRIKNFDKKTKVLLGHRVRIITPKMSNWAYIIVC